MLILLDIGNTSVTYGRYEGGRMFEFGSTLFDYFPKLIKKWTNYGAKEEINFIISSVVPKNTHTLKKILKPRYGFKAGARLFILGENLHVPLRHRYKTPKKLGIDRAVNVYGALRMYRAPLVVIDYGTAITFDYVSEKGVFEGGMIIPGPEIAFQALIDRAALLPKKIRLPEKSSSFLGKTTYDCMSSGILEGYGALTDGLVARFKERFGQDLKVIATGGFAGHLKPYTRSYDVLDPQHSIKSLLLIYKDWKSRFKHR